MFFNLQIQWLWLWLSGNWNLGKGTLESRWTGVNCLVMMRSAQLDRYLLSMKKKLISKSIFCCLILLSIPSLRALDIKKSFSYWGLQKLVLTRNGLQYHLWSVIKIQGHIRTEFLSPLRIPPLRFARKDTLVCVSWKACTHYWYSFRGPSVGKRRRRRFAPSTKEEYNTKDEDLLMSLYEKSRLRFDHQ